MNPIWLDLADWCRKNNAVIYSDNDGSVWICVGDDHYRCPMIGKSGPMRPFEQVIYRDMHELDKAAEKK